MVDHLTGHRTAVGETKAIDYVIQPALQKEQHVVACYAAHVGSHVIVLPELGLGYTIGPAALLLLTELQCRIQTSVTLTGLAMLAGDSVALYYRALSGIAAVALKEQLQRLPCGTACKQILYILPL